MSFKALGLIILSIVVALLGACLRSRDEDPRSELAAVSGRMAAENDLREVRFADLDNDGRREVIMVFGPRELLDFDVYYSDGSGDWNLTPMINDQHNPREFVSTRLDSIRDSDGDGIPEISVSSRLYDGNTMIKELHWMPGGYEVIDQRTVIAQAEPPRRTPQRTQEASASQAEPARSIPKDQAAEQKATVKTEPQPEPEPPPKPKPIPPVTPSTGTYMVKKGDTVYGLARELGISSEELESLNNNQLARRGLRIGQKITVPVPSKKMPNVSVRIEKERYQVKQGDSLSSIAERYGTTVRALKSWNPNVPPDGTIKVGQFLNIHHAVVDIKS
jgi:LysM repeat protein